MLRGAKTRGLTCFVSFLEISPFPGTLSGWKLLGHRFALLFSCSCFCCSIKIALDNERGKGVVETYPSYFIYSGVNRTEKCSLFGYFEQDKASFY